jgi:hypothetical protein
VQKKPLTISEIEAAYPDVLGQDIATLRTLRGLAVRDYDFARSDAIYRYMNLKNNNEDAKKLDHASQWLNGAFEAIAENYFCNVIALHALRDERELQARLEIDQLLIQIKRRHRRAFVPIFQKRYIALWHADQESGGVIFLKQQSVKEGFANHVDEAAELKSNADALYESERFQRRSEVIREYDQHFDRVFARQKEDLEQLDTQLKTLLSDVNARLEAELAEQFNHLIIALKFHLKKAIEDTVFDAETPARRGEIVYDLTTFLRGRIIQEEQSAWLVAVD